VKIINPDELAKPRGYNHGILATGRVLFISGQIGWDKNGTMAEGLATQFETALRNVLLVLESAGGKPEHVARLTLFIKDKEDYLNQSAEIGSRYRALMGKHFPAMSLLIVKDLLESSALVEIEATAVIP
jgi:enamine deaminase RidA (YjgF/YER057c/UK114 family)